MGRRKASAASAAFREARERLTESRGAGTAFRTELLENHARNQISAALIFPIFTVIIAAAAYQWHEPLHIILWAASTVFFQLLLVIQSRQYLSQNINDRQPEAWRRRMIALQLFAGCCWATLFVLDFGTETPLTLKIMQFSCLLIVMAMTAMVAFNVRAAVMLATAPALVVLVVKFGLSQQPAELVMSTVLIGAKIFFDVLARRLHANARAGLASQAEKDQLIVELETAKVISDEARRRAEEANLAKSRFLATMSHELRTPLNAILGFSEVISNEVMGPIENDHYKEYVNDIHASGTHLLNLINEILDLSRVEAGRYQLTEEPVRVGAIAEECIQMIKLRAQGKDLEVTGQIHPGLPQILADERAVRQIILNLLSNAVKFTPNGGQVQIKVGWTAGGGQYICVKDSGVGIPEEEIPIVLSSFGQGSIAIKSAEQGTGLGLPIVQALTHMHNGTFNLSSKLREGTEAIVTFPRRRVMEVMGAVSNTTSDPNSPDYIDPDAQTKRAFARSIFKGDDKKKSA